MVGSWPLIDGSGIGFAVFLRRAAVGAAKHPGEMRRGVIANDLGDVQNRELRVQQVILCPGHADLLQQIRKADAGVLLDECAEMGL